MDLISILRVLVDRRPWVGLGAALALCVAVLSAFEVSPGLPPELSSRQRDVGIASAAVLIDSPSSQVADLGDRSQIAPLTDVASLSSRARLLANLLAISPLKERIARRAGVEPQALTAAAPSPDLPLPGDAVGAAAGGRDVSRLTIDANAVLPIITANAEASSPRLAARISAAAVAELQAHLRSVARSDDVPAARQLVVNALGPAKSAVVTRGPRRLFALLAALVFLGLWCAGIVALAALRQGWQLSDPGEASNAPLAPVPSIGKARGVTAHAAGGE